MGNKTKVYAIALMADEAKRYAKKVKELGENTGYLGVNVHYPFLLVLYRSREDQAKGFKEFEKVFNCTWINKVGYANIPDKN